MTVENQASAALSEIATGNRIKRPAPKAKPAPAMPMKTGVTASAKPVQATRVSRATLKAQADALLSAKPVAVTGRKAKPEAVEAVVTAAKAARVHSKGARTANSRLITEILDGVTFAPGDWRKKHQGTLVTVQPFIVAGNEFTKTAGKPVPAFLAMPRDADLGMAGAEARLQGMIAMYIGTSEDGKSYVGLPFYVSEEELKSVTIKPAKISKLAR